MSPWYRRTEQGWLLFVHAVPGAKKTGVAGMHGEWLKVRIAAPPAQGRANEALVAFLADALGVSRGAISLARGASSRQKTVRVTDTGADPERLLAGRF